MSPRGLFAATALGGLLTLGGSSACSLTTSLDELQQGSGGGASTSSPSSSTSSAGGQGGGLACSAGTEDCDGDGLSCTELATSSAHCGACGHDCLGGACEEGRCQPVVIWTGGELDGRATGIDQTADQLYATTTLGVVRVPKAGGAPLFLVDGYAGPRIDADGAHAFYTSGDLKRVPLAGGAVETLAHENGESCRGVAVDATHAYAVRYQHVDDTLVELVRVPRDGGAEEVLPLDGTGAWGVSLDGDFAYVSARDGLFRIPKAGLGSAEKIFEGEAGDHVVFHEGLAYLLGAGLWAVDPDDEANTTLLDGELGSGQLTTDGQHLYYTLFEVGEVGRIRFDGSGREVLAEGLVGADVVVVDEQAVYFTHYYEQAIYRLAK